MVFCCRASRTYVISSKVSWKIFRGHKDVWILIFLVVYYSLKGLCWGQNNTRMFASMVPFTKKTLSDTEWPEWPNELGKSEIVKVIFYGCKTNSKRESEVTKLWEVSIWSQDPDSQAPCSVPFILTPCLIEGQEDMLSLIQSVIRKRRKHLLNMQPWYQTFYTYSHWSS